MNGKTLAEGNEPLQISFARSQSQPPLEWILQTSLMQPTYQAVVSFENSTLRFLTFEKSSYYKKD